MRWSGENVWKSENVLVYVSKFIFENYVSLSKNSAILNKRKKRFHS